MLVPCSYMYILSVYHILRVLQHAYMAVSAPFEARETISTHQKVTLMQVSFTLHQSFAIPNRDITSPPYEVHEQGWGEFDVQIKVSRLSSLAQQCPDCQVYAFTHLHRSYRGPCRMLYLAGFTCCLRSCLHDGTSACQLCIPIV